MKRVLITGASGFVGKHLLDGIDGARDFDVFTLVREKSGLTNEIILDLANSSFGKAVNDLPCVDVIIHLGARIGWDGSSRADLYAPNVLATKELANWAKRIGAYFIFSSAAITCGVKNTYINSESESNPDTDYGYSKWLAENQIEMSGVKHAILRCGGIFGKNGPKHLGLNRSISDVLEGKPPILYGSGKVRRNYIYVKDLVDVILYCIEKKVLGTHLAAGSHINSVYEMLKELCDIFLPGISPICYDGADGLDQVVEHSRYLPKGMTFHSAIQDIKKRTFL